MYKIIRVAASGSGTRYPVQIGAYCELTDMGITIDEAVTTSGGSVATAVKAKFKTSKQMEEMACDLLPRDHLDPHIWPFGGGTEGQIAGAKFQEQFRKLLGNKVEDLTGPRMHIATTNWTRGVTQVHTSGDLAPRLFGSMCLPIFDMVEIDGELHEDAGMSGANFLLDYNGWHNKDAKLPVIGLKVRSPNDPKVRLRPKTKLDRLMGSLDDMIAGADREHIEDATYACVVFLDTKAPGLNLLMGPDDVRSMIQEGRNAVKKAKLEGKLG
jgi:hypothetical protein